MIGISCGLNLSSGKSIKFDQTLHIIMVLSGLIRDADNGHYQRSRKKNIYLNITLLDRPNWFFKQKYLWRRLEKIKMLWGER